MTGERPCPCGGTNDNCSRCAGRGSYTPRSAKKSDGVVACRWCDLLFSPPLLQEHEGHCAKRRVANASIMPVCASQSNARKRKPRSEPRSDWTCPKCLTVVSTSNTDQEEALRRQRRHEELQHVVGSLPAKPALGGKHLIDRPAAAHADKEDWIECKTCHTELKLKNLSRHMRHVHKMMRPAPAQKPTGKQSRSTLRVAAMPTHVAEPDDDDTGELDDYATERRLDGSHDFWSLREESGQFGSYPSFDDFDDESEP
jgi:hypothetical protein